jgi:type IV pilus assembly protein PilQ
MFYRFILLLIAISCTLMVHSAFAITPVLSMNVRNANLPEAIRLMAKSLNINVMLSPAILGSTTIQLNEAYSQSAFELLLTSHDLAKLRMGNVWYIAPREELIKRKENEKKWMMVQEETAPLLSRNFQLQYAKAETIAQLLQDTHASLLSKRGNVRVDVRTNLVYVEDIAERLENIRQLITRTDVPVKQVVIEAKLISIDSDHERDLGIQFDVKNKSKSASSSNDGQLAPAKKGKYSIAVATLPDGSLLDIKLAALEEAGHAELISNPSLFTASQQSASIEAGEEVPYQEVSESGGTAVTFKKAVLALKVTPQVLPDKKILLNLQVNQDRPGTRMVLGVPTISTRQILTQVLIKNGETIVLGGIYETNHETIEEGLPFISQLPIIGWLFKQRNTRDNKRELLIFVTPRITN